MRNPQDPPDWSPQDAEYQRAQREFVEAATSEERERARTRINELAMRLKRL